MQMNYQLRVCHHDLLLAVMLTTCAVEQFFHDWVHVLLEIPYVNIAMAVISFLMWGIFIVDLFCFLGLDCVPLFVHLLSRLHLSVVILFPSYFAFISLTLVPWSNSLAGRVHIEIFTIILQAVLFMWRECIQIACGCTRLTFVLGFTLDDVFVS